MPSGYTYLPSTWQHGQDHRKVFGFKFKYHNCPQVCIQSEVPSYFLAIADSVQPGDSSNHSSGSKDLLKPPSLLLNDLRDSTAQSVVQTSSTALTRTSTAPTALAFCSAHPLSPWEDLKK